MKMIALYSKAPEKPRWGAPCNGCGVCCAAWPCPLSRFSLGHRAGPCPALVWGEARYHCGLVLAPRRYWRWLPAWGESFARRLIRRWIAAGRGCDCDAEVGL